MSDDNETRAAKIRKYWADRGHDIYVNVRDHAIRSDLSNALPRGVHADMKLDVAVPLKGRQPAA